MYNDIYIYMESFLLKRDLQLRTSLHSHLSHKSYFPENVGLHVPFPISCISVTHHARSVYFHLNAYDFWGLKLFIELYTELNHPSMP